MRTTNKLISALLFLVFLSSCNRSKEKNDLSELHIKAKPKSIHESTYYKFSYKEAEGGNKIVIENDYYTTDNIYETTTWEFNSDGNIKTFVRNLVKESSGFKKDDVNQTEVRKYDLMGRLKEEITTYLNGSTDTVIYEYEFMSQLCKSRKDILGEATFKYDAKGNEVEFFNPLSGIMKTQYTYNSIGAVTNKTITDESGAVQSKVDFYTDGDGKLTDEITFSPDGKVIEKKEYLNGILNKTIRTDFDQYEHSFNENEDVSTEIRFTDEKHKKQSHKQVYQYEYDENGNWIKRISCHLYGRRLVPDELKIREIEY